MLVASLLDGWCKGMELLGIIDKDSSNRDAIHRAAYNDFYDHHKGTLTPSKFQERFCHRFLAGGLSHRNKNGEFVCVCCRKLHPIITLYFDTNQQCTVAILSFSVDQFRNYFDQCVKEGNAIWKSPLYCELKGFVRENLFRLRHKQRFFGAHLVKVAIGALEDSDAAQSLLIEEAHLKQHLARHQRHIRRENVVNTESSTTVCAASKRYEDNKKLEVVLEICRLWGIGENLDVLSIHCMLRTSKVFRKVAIPIAKKRLKEVKFVITPLVDGHVMAGYSVFRRTANNRKTIIEKEQGKLIEYAMCSSTTYGQEQSKPTETTNDDYLCGRFLPLTCFNLDPNPNYDEGEFSPDFSWACEELTYANLELECMGLCAREYIGQKIVIGWKRSDIDTPCQMTKINQCNQGSSTAISSRGSEMPFHHVKICTRQQTGVMHYSIPHFHLILDIRTTSLSQIDEVTFRHEGIAEILECRADFNFLVAAYAHSLEACLQANFEEIEMMRPLMRHERAFLQEVQLAASMCTFSTHICK